MFSKQSKARFVHKESFHMLISVTVLKSEIKLIPNLLKTTRLVDKDYIDKIEQNFNFHQLHCSFYAP